jgi:putative protein-disulfide isomerase
MNGDFAAYAWSNDQRIERLTGQPFTGQYRERVLGDHQRLFDSGPATLALTAVFLTALARELEALKAIQNARYVDGKDTTSPQTLASVLRGLGLEQAAAMVEQPDEDLLSANKARMDRAKALMREFGAHGVPTLVAESGAKRWVVNHSDFYSNPRALAGVIEAA